MKIATMITFLTVSFFSFQTVHKDRIERPISVEFTFADETKIVVGKENLEKYSQDILSGRIKISKADIMFETGEKLRITSDKNGWSEMSISYGTKILSVPNKTLNKIPEIHFSTIELLWSDDSKKALESTDFYIKMDIGKEKGFEKFPYLNLIFENDKFLKAIIWKTVTEKSVRWADY